MNHYIITVVVMSMLFVFNLVGKEVKKQSQGMTVQLVLEQ